MLARYVGLDSLLLVRGTEGGVIPSFRADAHVVRYSGDSNDEEHDLPLQPLALARAYRAMDIPDSTPSPEPSAATPGMKWDIDAFAALCATEGQSALENKAGPIRDAAILGAAMTMWHIGHCADLDDAVKRARHAVESGEALRRLEAGVS